MGNNRLGKPGGSETFTYALVSELVSRGHKVECVALRKDGVVSKNIKHLDVPIHHNEIKGKFDLALLSHKTSIELSKKVKAFKIQTCHGIYPELEQPVPNMDAYVAISEEVKSHLKSKGYLSTVIYNGVDCQRFYPFNPINKNLKKILSLVHTEYANKIIEQVCKQIGCELIVQNKYKKPIWNVEQLINQVDLVIGLGRSAYEACACGRNVIVFDFRPYMSNNPIGDGFLDAENIRKYLMNNCSGRYSMKQMGTEALYAEMRKYNTFVGERLRLFALEHLNIEKQVDKYLALVR